RWGAPIFILAKLSLGATAVVYNAFLPEIAPPQTRDRVSSRGYALGYLGGALLLAANLVFMAMASRLGISTGRAARLSFLSAGLWWFAFSAITFRFLRARGTARPLARGQTYVGVARAQLALTLRELARLPHTRRFLAAYLL